MAQNLDKQTDTRLIDISGLIDQEATTPGRYPFTAGLLSEIKVYSQILAEKRSDLVEKEAAFRAASALCDAMRQQLLASLSTAAKIAEADPNVSDTMLRAIGLQPRPERNSRPRTPIVPTDLVANPSADGRVRLAWKGGGNGPRIAYAVETSADGVVWSYLPTTTRQSTVLEGYAPGLTAWFRVRATNAGMISVPTAPVAVYAPAAALRVEEGGKQAA